MFLKQILFERHKVDSIKRNYNNNNDNDDDDDDDNDSNNSFNGSKTLYS